MSYREAWVFIRHLPADSWTQTVIRDERLEELVNPEPEPSQPNFGPWSLLNHQVAVLTDAVKELTYVTALGRLKDPPRPELTPRPVPRRRSTVIQSPEAIAYLEKLRAPRSLTAG